MQAAVGRNCDDVQSVRKAHFPLSSEGPCSALNDAAQDRDGDVAADDIPIAGLQMSQAGQDDAGEHRAVLPPQPQLLQRCEAFQVIALLCSIHNIGC